MMERLNTQVFCTCISCLYTFEATAIPERCPDCGKPTVLKATDKEIDCYQKVHEEETKEA